MLGRSGWDKPRLVMAEGPKIGRSGKDKRRLEMVEGPSYVTKIW